MALMNKLEAVLFDLDGTLLDSFPDFLVSLQNLNIESSIKEIDQAVVRTNVSDGSSKLLELVFNIDKNDKNFDSKVNNFLRFAMDNFETELVVMGIKLALTQYSLPIDPDAIECFDEFHDRYGKYIKAAQGV